MDKAGEAAKDFVLFVAKSEAVVCVIPALLGMSCQSDRAMFLGLIVWLD